eukprot:1333464-Amphidinium_carterae.1
MTGNPAFPPKVSLHNNKSQHLQQLFIAAELGVKVAMFYLVLWVAVELSMVLLVINLSCVAAGLMCACSLYV